MPLLRCHNPIAGTHFEQITAAKTAATASRHKFWEMGELCIDIWINGCRFCAKVMYAGILVVASDYLTF